MLQTDLIRLISDGIFGVLVLGFILYKIIQHRSAVKFEDGPVLSSEEMLSSSGLTSLQHGTLVGFNYNVMVNDTGRSMMLVELGHSSGVHIVAYGDKSKLDTNTAALISSKWLEPASLEGNFPDYFHMYCSPSNQMEVREVFTPDTMVEFIDFCRAYDFEIFDDTLYISQAEDAEDKSDNTTLTSDAETLLQHKASLFRHL